MHLLLPVVSVYACDHSAARRCACFDPFTACMQEAGEEDKHLSPEELERIEMMHKYVLSNAHFYCETVDISRPFPSSSPVSEPSWEFVWNRWLSAGLRAIGLSEHCPHLMQVGRALALPVAYCQKVLSYLKDTAARAEHCH